MTSLHTLPILVLLLLFPLAVHPAAAQDASASPAAKAFERFKQLEGTWTGQSESGKSVEMTFRLTGDGSSVMEHFRMGDDHDMFTVYHLDGDTIMLTHYCASGNQPRMRAADFSGERIRFDFVDVTGLAAPTDGHMHHAAYEFDGPDQFRTAWTWRENGADAFTEVIAARRAVTVAANR